MYHICIMCALCLHRWLQPERSVDMNSVDIVITEGQHAVGSDVEVSIVIRDQTGTVVAVPDMQVSCGVRCWCVGGRLGCVGGTVV